MSDELNSQFFIGCPFCEGEVDAGPADVHGEYAVVQCECTNCYRVYEEHYKYLGYKEVLKENLI